MSLFQRILSPFDLFKQNLQFRASNKLSHIPTPIGAIFTLVIVTVSIIYFQNNLNILINHDAANIIAVETLDYYDYTNKLQITIGKPIEGSNLEFRLQFAVWDSDTNLRPKDLDRIGTFVV